MKKLVALALAVIMSMVFINSASAANTFGSVNVGPWDRGYTQTVDGSGQYGRITLEGTAGSYADAYVEVYSDGQWRSPTINDPDLGYLLLNTGVSRDTTNYFFEKGKKYRLYVSTIGSDYSAKGYIRTYD
ncbi:hypothetical protein ES066_16685 [Bacillus subtilis]|uniref:hypothetical protein n=1 Tax=Bacillus subtilis TaxID=1423 RepID=UPI00102E5B49|nr:hypothetical protein [Bacillus subtilis]TAH79769.1 hypothetical protein ES060_16680 [Bacillus subtilis]TAH86804.1 hypothetical protein ES066_16685 [Bacillus subtilis]